MKKTQEQCMLLEDVLKMYDKKLTGKPSKKELMVMLQSLWVVKDAISQRELKIGQILAPMVE